MDIYTLCPRREEQDLLTAITSLLIPPNKRELCRLKCSTRRCHQVEAPSQALPSLPGLMLQSWAGSEAAVGQPLLFPLGQLAQ